MCGRYIFYDDECYVIQQLVEMASKKMSYDSFKKLSLYEVKPSNSALVAIYIPKENKIVYKSMIWGYPYKNKLIINARSETCFDSVFFQNSYQAIVIASSYIEWDTQHIPYKFTLEEKPIYLAALAKYINKELHFVILTEEATNDQASIHSRQPLLFTKEQAKKWCTSSTPTSMFSYSLQDRIISRY